MLSKSQRSRLKQAFRSGQVRVRGVSPNGTLHWCQVLHVTRAEIGPESVVRGATRWGSFTTTGGHRVFTDPVTKVEAEKVVQGSFVLCAPRGATEAVSTQVIQGVQPQADRRFMYDLTADHWHNFVLHNSRLVISNSPDKFYRFRPPEHEGSIGQYNRIFGQIWEDAEIYMYLEYALDWINMFPPQTRIDTLDKLVTDQRSWRSAVIMEAIARACFAVSANWIADEFSYSIGGVSLDLEKSSKYESLKQNAESQVERFAEAKARTVKFIRGLQQPRFGLGVRSAFGPQVGRGVLSPRNFTAGLTFCCLTAKVIGMEVAAHVNYLSTLWS